MALGSLWLPTDPSPGFGGILVAWIVAAGVNRLDDELRDGLDVLINDLERGARFPAPAPSSLPDRRRRPRQQPSPPGGVGRIDGPAARRPCRRLAPSARGRLRRGQVCPTGPGRMSSACCAGPPDGTPTTTSDCSATDGDEAAYRPWPGVGRDEHWALKVLGYNVPLGADPQRHPDRVPAPDPRRPPRSRRTGRRRGPAHHRPDRGQAHPAGRSGRLRRRARPRTADARPVEASARAERSPCPSAYPAPG